MTIQEAAGENLFWAYSLSVYRRREVAQCCLMLQDDVGIDVNLLLYAAWLAGRGRRLDSHHLELVVSAVADWQDRVVKPLRGLRRQLREVAGAELIREGLKAQELRAEARQQDTMYACYHALDTLPSDRHCLRQNLAVVCRYGHSEASVLPDALDALVRALAG